MSDVIVPAVIVGGAVYVLAKGMGTPTAPGDVAYQSPNYGSTLDDITAGIPNGGGGSTAPGIDNGGQAGFNIPDGRLADPDAAQKLDLLNSALQKAYSGMSSAAKQSAADNLNTQLHLDPPLKGNETWETVARVAGGAGGALACNAIPGIGTAASPLCAMAGAYLGVKLENWMQTELPGLQSWVSDNLGSVVNSIGDQISDWFHDIF